MDLSFIGYSFRLRGIKCFIQRGFGVGIQIVHHQANLLCMGILLINKFLDKVRPINFCPLCSDLRITLTRSWCKSDKNLCSPIALLVCVIPQ